MKPQEFTSPHPSITSAMRTSYEPALTAEAEPIMAEGTL